jgi:small GTP-binding protein
MSDDSDCEEEEYNEEEIKVILIGSTGVGKTSIINVITGGKFNINEKSTEGSSFLMKKIKVNEKEYILNIWDTIGQEKLRQLTKIFYNNSKLVIFVYDITSKESFEDLNYWTKDVEEQIGKDTIKGVVANKIDLYLNEKVTTDEGKNYAKSIQANFIEFSAKTEPPSKFEDFLIELLEKYLPKKTDTKNNKKIVLKKSDLSKGKKPLKCCKSD